MGKLPAILKGNCSRLLAWNCSLRVPCSGIYLDVYGAKYDAIPDDDDDPFTPGNLDGDAKRE